MTAPEQQLLSVHRLRVVDDDIVQWCNRELEHRLRERRAA